ncbi:cytochrome d ubiquinol oxidase subunit II [Pseudonocardia endophytica]|uniref:Cytochrome bd-type quinol oxidase subunit 2 n=1 Tax=Pseudonocardia endophytica TaxID=401976 RepID=A0A4V2PIQ5_PSEEN|nr:cytochrome d ubiquinol oxidase subunit II [Pseudonocardia endophytica]TCK25556.1 cytochrome bd-type quinol oxidase subunit 2 [Pseudonocardia endophytica]
MTAASPALLVAVLAAFVGLDGIGRGTALRAVTGTAGRDRGLVLAGTGPQLLLGHVWMVAAAGLLVGLFPRWESAVVASAYWWVLAIAAGLVLRVAALGVAALGIPRPGARTGTGPNAVRSALAATGALATAAGTGGFLAVAAGVWPVLGVPAVIGFDVVVSGWALGVRVPMWTLALVGALLVVPAVVLAAGGAVLGAAVVAVLVVAGVLLARRPVFAGTLLATAAVAPMVARWPDLAVPGSGTVPVAELVTSPAGAALVTGVAGPTFVLVLAVQIWFWRGAGPGPGSSGPAASGAIPLGPGPSGPTSLGAVPADAASPGAGPLDQAPPAPAPSGPDR